MSRAGHGAVPPRPRLAAWRAAVALSGLIGYGFAAARFESPLSALSQQASLLAGIVYAVLALAALARPGTSLAWLRGAMAVLLALVALGYAFLLVPDYAPVHSLFEHAVTPLLVLIDVLVVERRAGRWWWPLSWLALPLAYLAYYLAADLSVYAFLDPAAANFGGLIAGLLVAILVIGYAILGLGRIGSPRGHGPAGG